MPTANLEFLYLNWDLDVANKKTFQTFLTSNKIRDISHVTSVYQMIVIHTTRDF